MNAIYLLLFGYLMFIVACGMRDEFTPRFSISFFASSLASFAFGFALYHLLY